MARKPQLNLNKGNTYTVTLKYDEPKSGNNAYGPWYLYTADYNGQEVVFFAKEPLHKQIQRTNARTGDTITIAVDERGYYSVGDANGSNMSMGEDEDPFTPPAVSPPTGVSATHKPTRSFDGLVEDYQACLGAAAAICVAEFEEYTNEDVRSIATTLYIQGTREGVDFPKE